MKRRYYAGTALLAAAALLSLAYVIAAGKSSPPPADSRPNIILLLTDDQRWDALSCMGNPIVETPQIDRLAAEGTVFNHAFVTTSICALSRISFLTGQYVLRHGIADFETPLSDEQLDRSYPMMLRKAGYRVAFVGKWGIGGDLPADRYDDWYGYAGQGSYYAPGESMHLTDIHARDALEFLDDCAPGVPFCLQVSFKAPHADDPDYMQFTPARRFQDLYAETPLELAPSATQEAHAALPLLLRDSEAAYRWQGRAGTPEDREKSIKDYYRLIAGIDEAVGRIRTKLDEKGLGDNTIIIFTSDNGFYLGEHGLSGKWYMHEESIRVPMIVFDPRQERSNHAERRDEIVLNIDVAPTILDLAGVTDREHMQGRSLAPLVRGETVDWRDEFYYEYPFYKWDIKLPQCEGAWTRRWKYARYFTPEASCEQLFDLESDPWEMNDLADDPAHAETLREARERLQVLREQASISYPRGE